MDFKLKKTLYIDMDGVLCDFMSGVRKFPEDVQKKYANNPEDIPGLFATMDEIPEAVESVKALSKIYNVYILSTVPWRNPLAYEEKIHWLWSRFGNKKDSVIYKRVIFSHNKQLADGDFLVDDNTWNGADKFKGELIRFGHAGFENWRKVAQYLQDHWLADGGISDEGTC
jgi:5'(3')-deoxyribonucleotidase